MKRVLLIQGVISNYRVPVYNEVAKYFDLTVAYSKGEVPKKCVFNTIFLETKDKRHFVIHKQSIRKIAKQYDAVIGMMSPNWISIFLLAFFKSKYKFLSWGIGVPASYSVKYDDPQKKISSFLIKTMVKHSDAAIFYSDYPKEKYIKQNISSKKMFVAHNTVEVEKMSGSKPKDCILFVGSLYKAKGIDSLLHIYFDTLKEEPRLPLLRIVGSGADYQSIEKWIHDNQMKDNILLEGPIYDEHKLSVLFERAYACVSLGQAGLSVQKSMGYGVPFITEKDSYTGGERFDIKNGKNGLLLKSEEDFHSVLKQIVEKPEWFEEMGRNAFEFYHNHRTVEQMAKSVISALEFALNDRIV